MRRFAVIHMIAFVSVFAFARAKAADLKVLVITSKDAPIYLETSDALPKFFKADYTVVKLPQAKQALLQPHDAVVAVGTEAAVFAVRAEKRKPIFFGLVVREEDPGLRGVNVTGLSLNPSPGKHFERLKKTLTKVHRVGVLDNFTGRPAARKEMMDAAKAHGLEAVVCELRVPKDIPGCLQLLLKEKVDVVLAQPRGAYDEGGLYYLGKNQMSLKVPMVGTGRAFAQKYQFLHALAPDAQGTAQDLARLMTDRLVLRKRLPLFNEPQYLVQFFNSNVAKKLGVAEPAPNHVRVVDTTADEGGK